jgi:hypothetical protein
LKNLLNREQLQRVIELAEKHDIRMDRDHRIHLAEQKFRGRLTYLSVRPSPVDRLFHHRQPNNAGVTSERAPLLLSPGRASA